MSLAENRKYWLKTFKFGAKKDIQVFLCPKDTAEISEVLQDSVSKSAIRARIEKLKKKIKAEEPSIETEVLYGTAIEELERLLE